MQRHDVQEAGLNRNCDRVISNKIASDGDRQGERFAKCLNLRVRLHDLRHTSASLMLAAGVNIKLVSERLGHSSSAFTMDTYTHLLDNAQAEAAERLADLLGNGASKSDDPLESIEVPDQTALMPSV